MERVLLTILTILLLKEQVSPAAITGPEGDLIEGKSSANLTCIGTERILAAEWFKDNWILDPSDRIEFSEDNTSLLISPVQRSDSGEYRCILTYDNSSSDTANYSMTIYYGPDVRVLGGARVDEGSDILLFCSVVSLPAASVTWTVNGESAGHSALLIIESSKHSHSGKYTCTAFNSITGVTASAVHFLTVTGTVTGPGLSPGAAAGITVAVILVLEGLAVGLYFLIIYLKNTDDPVCKIPRPKKNKQNREPPRSYGVREEDELKTTEFKDPPQPSREAPRAERERPNEPLYENNKPRVSRHSKPTQVTDRGFNTRPPIPEQDTNMKPPILPKRDLKMKPPKLPDRVNSTDSDVYSTQFP